MHVQLINKPTNVVTGTTRYTDNLSHNLRSLGIDVEAVFPSKVPPWDIFDKFLKLFNIDVRSFFNSYPFHVPTKDVDLYHITGQTLATLLMFQRFNKPVIVTVLDIIPYLLQKDNELEAKQTGPAALFYSIALKCLKRADSLIAISEYSKKTAIDELGLKRDKFHVIYPAVDHDRFYPRDVPKCFYNKFNLDPKNIFILNVGSEDPRKNINRLIKAFSFVKGEFDNVQLLKVGTPHCMGEHEELLKLSKNLGLQDSVLFFDQISDEDLPLFYNIADIFVMPSLYEGFGLPALEAMASGTPVISSNSASLPEVVGDAALLFEPYDVDALVGCLLTLLRNEQKRKQLSSESIRRATLFTWQNTAKQTIKVYEEVITRYD